ncbi:MAG: hypothetical protein FH749_00240 [Firmicutes bacterium]|nr:hypothetical protein [Bacillota bacterium]
MAKTSKDRNFTVMLVPHSQKPPVIFRFSLLVLQFLGIALVFVPVILVSFFNSFYSVQSVLPELEELRLDNQIKSEQIEQMANETQVILDNLRRLEQLEQELMEITDMDEAGESMISAAAAEPENGPENYRAVASRSSYTTYERTISNIMALQEALPDQEERMENLKETIEEQQRREAATPSIWPTWGRISSPFGWRRHPLSGGQDYHTGIDIAGPSIYGNSVFATGNGRVTFAGYRSSYGYLIIVDHGYGLQTYYAHLSRIRVQSGQVVEKGQLIGNVGNSGASTGPHLHYEVRRYGSPVNPINYLP